MKTGAAGTLSNRREYASLSHSGEKHGSRWGGRPFYRARFIRTPARRDERAP